MFEQKKIDDALSDAYVDKSAGVISTEEFSIISPRLKAKKDDLVKSYDSLCERLDKLFNLQNAESKAIQMVVKYQNYSELTREILGAFNNVIYVGERDAKTNDFELEINLAI